MIYLINCEVVRSRYMSITDKESTNHIVEADTEQEAADKLRKFYADRDSEYCVEHWVNINYCNSLIR